MPTKRSRVRLGLERLEERDVPSWGWDTSFGNQGTVNNAQPILANVTHEIPPIVLSDGRSLDAANGMDAQGHAAIGVKAMPRSV